MSSLGGRDPLPYSPDRDSLSDVLARLGWTYHAGLSPGFQLVSTSDGEVLHLRAGQCWDLLRERGLIVEVAQ